MSWPPGNLLEQDYTSASLNTLFCLDKSVASPRDAHAFSYIPFIDIIPPTIPGITHKTIQQCRYPCLHPVLHLVADILPPDAACDLLGVYFAEPEMTRSANTCPYVLSPVIQRKSLLRVTSPRPTCNALLIAILWTVSHTARVAVLEDPTTRSVVMQRLWTLLVRLLQARERQWDETRGLAYTRGSSTGSYITNANDHRSPYKQSNTRIDDVLTYIVLTSVKSQTGSREDCLMWWAKALSLLNHLRLNSETHIAGYTSSAAQETETREECRRVYWLAYALDRHLAFIFNKPLDIHDSDCDVLCPLPEWIWRDIDRIPAENLPARRFGPPRAILGTGFFEYFLPLVAVLGELVEGWARGRHPRLGGDVDASRSDAFIESRLALCEHSLAMLQAVSASLRSSSIDLGQKGTDHLRSSMPSSSMIDDSESPRKSTHTPVPGRMLYMQQHTELVFAYSRSMIQFLHLLLVSTFPKVTDDCLCLSTAHSVAAKECIGRMHSEHRDLPNIPFVLGVYLDCVDVAFASALA